MLNVKLFLVIILQSIIFIWAGSIRDRLMDEKGFNIVRIAPCSHTNLPYKQFIQFGKSNLRRVVIKNITAMISEDLNEKLKLTVSMIRCSSRENLDSCEDYHKLRNLDYCQCISGVGNPVRIPFEPQLKCPIKKGVYTALNITITATPFLVFNIDGWYWKCLVEVNSPKENNRPIMCTEVEGYTKL